MGSSSKSAILNSLSISVVALVLAGCGNSNTSDSSNVSAGAVVGADASSGLMKDQPLEVRVSKQAASAEQTAEKINEQQPKVDEAMEGLTSGLELLWRNVKRVVSRDVASEAVITEPSQTKGAAARVAIQEESEVDDFRSRPVPVDTEEVELKEVFSWEEYQSAFRKAQMVLAELPRRFDRVRDQGKLTFSALNGWLVEMGTSEFIGSVGVSADELESVATKFFKAVEEQRQVLVKNSSGDVAELGEFTEVVKGLQGWSVELVEELREKQVSLDELRVSVMRKMADLDNALDNWGVESAEGDFSDRLRQNFARAVENNRDITKKFNSLNGHSMTLLPMPGEDGLGINNAVAAFFRKQEVRTLVKLGVLHSIEGSESQEITPVVGVAEQLYRDVFRGRLGFEYVHKVNFFSNDTTYYTLEDLRKIVEITRDKPPAEVLKMRGNTDRLSGKPFPEFDEKPGKNRIVPKQEDLDKIEQELQYLMQNILADLLLEDDATEYFFKRPGVAEGRIRANAQALSAGLIGDASKGSYRGLRQDAFGIDAGGFMLNGSRGEKIAFDLPVSVSLHGKVESGKSVDTTGSVATKLGNTLVGISQAYVNTGTGFTSESLQTETSVMVGQKLGAAFAEVHLGSVDAKGVNKADFSGRRTQVTLGVDTTYITPFVQLTHRNLDRQGLLMKSNVSETTVALGAEVDIAKHTTDAYQVDLNVSGKVGYNSKSWTAYGKDLGTDTGMTGSLEMKGSLKLNTGMTLSSNLSFGSAAGSSAGLNLSLDR